MAGSLASGGVCVRTNSGAAAIQTARMGGPGATESLQKFYPELVEKPTIFWYDKNIGTKKNF